MVEPDANPKDTPEGTSTGKLGGEGGKGLRASQAVTNFRVGRFEPRTLQQKARGRTPVPKRPQVAPGSIPFDKAFRGGFVYLDGAVWRCTLMGCPLGLDGCPHVHTPFEEQVKPVSDDAGTKRGVKAKTR